MMVMVMVMMIIVHRADCSTTKRQQELKKIVHVVEYICQHGCLELQERLGLGVNTHTLNAWMPPIERRNDN